MENIPLNSTPISGEKPKAHFRYRGPFIIFAVIVLFQVAMVLITAFSTSFQDIPLASLLNALVGAFVLGFFVALISLPFFAMSHEIRKKPIQKIEPINELTQTSNEKIEKEQFSFIALLGFFMTIVAAFLSVMFNPIIMNRFVPLAILATIVFSVLALIFNFYGVRNAQNRKIARISQISSIICIIFLVILFVSFALVLALSIFDF